MNRKSFILAALAAVAFAFASCQQEKIDDGSIGKPGDGLFINLLPGEITASAPSGNRTLTYSITGYVPKNVRLEAYGHNLDSWEINATSISAGKIAISKAPKDTASLRIIAFNGQAIVMQEVLMKGTSATLNSTAAITVKPAGATVPLDFIEGESYSITTDPASVEWVSINGLEASVAKNEGEKGRTVMVNISHPARQKPLKFKITQAAAPKEAEVVTPDDEKEQYKAEFEAFVARATGKTHSAQTPMGKHYNNAAAITEANITWFANATNEPDMTSEFPNATWQAFNVNLYPYGEPSPADVNQHLIGDCCACAVFAEMAYVFPDYIKHIIKDNGNKTYTVSMYDPKGTPISVTVSNKFLKNAKGETVGLTGKNGVITWASVLEKAMMKWETIFKVDGIGGIGTEFVVPLFTGNGNSFAFSPKTLTNAEMKRMVEVMQGYRMFIIGGFTKSDVAIGSGTTVSGHAFSFMKTGKEGCLFAMRNPWGSNGDGSGDGVLNIPDDDTIPPMIDFRIIYPGAAEAYAVKEITPYKKPF